MAAVPTCGRITAPPLVPFLAALAILVGALSVLVGPAPLSPAEIGAALLGGGDQIARDIVFQIRAPRALLSLLIGAMLGLSGAALQGLLRNPLADPAVIGTSSSASLGAVIALYFGVARAAPLALPLMAVAGALLGLAALLPIARRSEGPSTLILAGVAVSALAGAGVSLALNLAPNPFAVSEIAFWLLGSLSDRSLEHVLLATPLIAAGAALILFQARALDGLALGEDAARSLGFDLGRVGALVAAGVAIGVGAAVAVSGSIGFVGLVAPYLARPFTDQRPSRSLAPSALIGAVLLGLADILVRLIPTSTELRLGVVTAMIGAPVFIGVLLRPNAPGAGR
ncbi:MULTISPECIES: FecCD family ABC transporter permease [Methylosinus]|uniref:Iron ABC transporter permease n=1 Tax=Methylosinus trichosporium (strain ATCC 35070 / NCIMB 11131 / UNIQEM 75 / OB3b) TaxID=595536 RepID=A0A2D2D3F8_METT3|nr:MULTISPECIES: iron ABC transporter permease [Methylosinus]ATQ69533.1 iron ABC transporter permease [Methylosinus trichosporium OB3b]